MSFFKLKTYILDIHGTIFEVRSVASDGRFLYLYTSKGLLKIGSGYGGTVKGHIYMLKVDLIADSQGWLGFANVRIFIFNKIFVILNKLI